MADLSKFPTEVYTPAPSPTPDQGPADKLVQSAPGAEGVQNPYDAMIAGWRMSPTGLMQSGGKPVDTSIPKNAGFFTGLADNMAETAAGLVGSIVPSIVGGVAGAAAGAESGPGAAVTGVLGAAVAPQAVRETMLDYYKSNHSAKPMTASDFTQMVATSAWNIAKGTAESLPILSEGGAVPSGFSTPQKGQAFANQATEFHSQVEPHMPDASDFAVQAHNVSPAAAKAAQPQLEGVYRQAGTQPWEAANAAKADPKLRDELVSHDVNGDPVIPKFNAQAAEEPEPFKEAPKPNLLVARKMPSDTRGQGQFFHGTSRPISKLEDYPGNSESNIYGGGLYTTDAEDVAKGYSSKGNGTEKSIYAVNKTGKENLLDMDASMPASVSKIVSDYAEHSELAGAALENGPKTLRGVYDEMRAESSGLGISKSGVQEEFDSLAYNLQKAGYTGLQHIGGKNTKTAPHTVQIHWEPQSQGITVSPHAAAEPTIKYGKPGQVHGDLLSDEELNGPINDKEMGFAQGEGQPFMSRQEAAAFRGKPAGSRLESVQDQIEQAGGVIPAFGRKDIGSFKTNPAKIANEHEAEMADINSAGARDAIIKQLLPKLQGDDDAISPTGAVGRYQVQPGLARQFGLDPEKLTDPKYNEAAATHILNQLSIKYHGDQELILAHYTGGPKAATTMMLNGRDTEDLPPNAQQVLTEAGFGGKGGKPPEPPVPLREPPEPPEGEEPDYSKLSTEMRLARFRDAIGQEQPSNRKTPFGLEFELDAAKRVDNVLKTRGLLDPNSKDLNIEDMFRQTYGSESRANHFFERGPVDPVTFEEKPGTSLKAIADEIKSFGGNKDEFNLYRSSLRTIEKAKQGVDTGIFKGGLKEAMDNASDPKLKRYAKANEMMQDFKHGVLEYVRDSHGISQGQLDAMEKMNTSHVSFRRIMGDDAPFAATTGRRMFGSNPIKAMEGSDRQIVDPWTADIDNARMMIRFADRNRAALAVVQSQEKAEALGLTRISGTPRATLAEPGSNVFKPYDMNEKQAEAAAPLIDVANGKGNTFRVYRNGKPETWEAKDPNLARLVRGADTPAEATLISKVAQFPAKLERAGIAFAPDFGPRVLLKHQITAFILDPAHPPPFITMLRGALSAINKDDAFWELARNGGLTGSITNLDHEYMDTDAQHLMDTTGFANRMWNTVKHPLQFAQLVTERMTAASRIGYSAQQKAAGVPAAKAAMQGRKAYLDYDEKFVSDIANNWAKWVPFFKADILGLKQGWDAIQPGRLGSTALYTTLGLVLPQVAMYALNRKADEHLPFKQRYTSLPQWERDLYFVSPPIGGVRVKMGKPYNVGPLLGIPLERFLENEYEKDPDAFDDTLKQMVGGEMPNITPAVAKPVMEGMSNYNFFTGLPLVPDSLKDATSDAQYVDSTSEVAKRISALVGSHPTPAVKSPLNVVNVSPIVLDNYVEEWSGTIGPTILHLLDTPLGHVSGPFDIANLPFARGFLVRNPGMETQQVNDFYTDAKKVEGLAADKALEIKRNQGPAALADYEAVGKKLTLARGVEHVLAIQRRMLEGINANKQMNVDEKRQESEKIYGQAWTLAVAGSRALRGNNASQ